MKNISNNFSKNWGYKVVSVYHLMRLQLKEAWIVEMYFFFNLCIQDRINLLNSEVHSGLNFQVNLGWRFWNGSLGKLPSLPDRLHIVIGLLLTCLTSVCPWTVLFANLGLCISLGRCWCWFSSVTSLWHSLKILWFFFSFLLTYLSFPLSWMFALFLSY